MSDVEIKKSESKTMLSLMIPMSFRDWLESEGRKMGLKKGPYARYCLMKMKEIVDAKKVMDGT